MRNGKVKALRIFESQKRGKILQILRKKILFIESGKRAYIRLVYLTFD